MAGRSVLSVLLAAPRIQLPWFMQPTHHGFRSGPCWPRMFQRNRGPNVDLSWPRAGHLKQLFTLLDLCVSSLRRGHGNLLCIVPSLPGDPRRDPPTSAQPHVTVGPHFAVAPPPPPGGAVGRGGAPPLRLGLSLSVRAAPSWPGPTLLTGAPPPPAPRGRPPPLGRCHTPFQGYASHEKLAAP